MWAPTTRPRNDNIWMGTLNGVGRQGQERSCWKVLQQAQAGILPSPGRSQEVLESTLYFCGQERPEHGPSTVGVPQEWGLMLCQAPGPSHTGCTWGQRVRGGKGTALLCCGPAAGTLLWPRR